MAPPSSTGSSASRPASTSSTCSKIDANVGARRRSGLRDRGRVHRQRRRAHDHRPDRTPATASRARHCSPISTATPRPTLPSSSSATSRRVRRRSRRSTSCCSRATKAAVFAARGAADHVPAKSRTASSTSSGRSLISMWPAPSSATTRALGRAAASSLPASPESSGRARPGRASPAPSPRRRRRARRHSRCRPSGP